MKINNITVKDPKYNGVVITDEPIWSNNTGRSNSLKMLGTLKGWKTTIAVTWGRLSFAEAQTIRNAIYNAGGFFPIEYNDFSANTTVTKTVYVDHIPRKMVSLALQKYEEMTIEFIEQ